MRDRAKHKKTILIDCDPGIDDALAVLLAFSSRELIVHAVTAVYGNAPLSRTLENLLGILKLSNATPLPAVGRGCDSPLNGGMPEARRIHGPDGLAGANLNTDGLAVDVKDGIDLIVRSVSSGAVDSVIALGPLTNIACAISKEPKIKKKLPELIIMGGALYDKIPEFNINSDPEAARAVFNSGIPIRLVSLDAAKKVLLKKEDISCFEKADNRLARFIFDITSFYIDFNVRTRKRQGAFLSDPLAVGIAADENLASFKGRRLDVLTHQREAILVETRGRPNISFCEDVDAAKFLDLFLNRLLGFCGTRKR